LNPKKKPTTSATSPTKKSSIRDTFRAFKNYVNYKWIDIGRKLRCMLLCNELVEVKLAKVQQGHKFFGQLAIVAMNCQDLEEQQPLLEHIPLLCNV
jgi:hypothetical protein